MTTSLRGNHIFSESLHGRCREPLKMPVAVSVEPPICRRLTTAAVWAGVSGRTAICSDSFCGAGWSDAGGEQGVADLALVRGAFDSGGEPVGQVGKDEAACWVGPAQAAVGAVVPEG